MLNGLWGKKVGMTQVFHNNQVVPVTVIDLSNWFVTQVKTNEKDGYTAVQVGLLKSRFAGQEFSTNWLKKMSSYFSHIKEVQVGDSDKQYVVGQAVVPQELLAMGDSVDAFGITIGHGFQGVVKKLNWAGGKASHGSKLGRHPGSLGTCRSSGDVFKGHGMPGHMGVAKRVTQNLEVVEMRQDMSVALIKGSMPGKPGTIVFLRKRG